MGNSLKRFVSIVLLSFAFIGIQAVNATTYKTPGIRGTDHDFANRFGCYDSSTGTMKANCTPWTNSRGRPEDEICIFCHTPHHANTAEINAPLWNRALTNTSYVPYPSIDEIGVVIGQPNGVSKLCLSCHDGTVAIDAYGTNVPGAGHTMQDVAGGNGGGWGNSGPNLGTDLSADHPISFTFNSAVSTADPGMFDPTVQVSHIGDLPSNPGMPNTVTVVSVVGSGSTNTIAQDMLDTNSQVQCTSCHEPHNKYGWNKFLVKNNTGSGLCLTCHNK